MNGRHWLSPVFAIGILLSLVACTANLPPAGQARPATSTPARPVPSSTAPATGVALPVAPVGEPVVIASGLDAPWSLLRLPVGGTLISERDTALVRELLADGSLRTVGTVPGVAPAGEGGLLGLAFLGEASGAWVYAYFTAETDNRIVRMPLLGSVDGYSLGAPEVVLEGIPKAGNHDGGRIAFGPDGLLYASVGDAGNPDSAQDRDALGGKILRLGPTGDVPADNPFGTLVYSYGHRNPQGIAWDSRNRLWASEFGQNTWDELNLIEAGGNYGWPAVEGITGGAGFIDPVQQWSTDEASPSGIAIVNDTLFMASLRGARLWRVELTGDASSPGAVDEWFVNSYGRLRDVVSGPDGTLWFVSNNTDGRGAPLADDDRLYQVAVAP